MPIGSNSSVPASAGADLSEPESLLAQARNGDPEAYGELCRHYESALFRHAITLCGDPAQGEDLAEDTLVEGWKSLHRYNGRCRFFTWLCAILLNRYRNQLRQRRRFPFSWLTDSGDDDNQGPSKDVPDEGTRPDQALELNEQAESVRRCVQALPPKHREIIYLRFYVDTSLEGIAAATGCSVGTVKSRLFHALEKLRAMKTLATLTPHTGSPIPPKPPCSPHSGAALSPGAPSPGRLAAPGPPDTAGLLATPCPHPNVEL